MTGSELRALRYRLGLTQVQMATQLKTSQGFLCDLEHGRRPVTPEFEVRLLALVPTAPPGLCGTCLCVVAYGVCGCRERAAA